MPRPLLPPYPSGQPLPYPSGQPLLHCLSSSVAMFSNTPPPDLACLIPVGLPLLHSLNSSAALFFLGQDGQMDRARTTFVEERQGGGGEREGDFARHILGAALDLMDWPADRVWGGMVIDEGAG